MKWIGQVYHREMIPILEGRMEKTREIDMETGIVLGSMGNRFAKAGGRYVGVPVTRTKVYWGLLGVAPFMEAPLHVFISLCLSLALEIVHKP